MTRTSGELQREVATLIKQRTDLKMKFRDMGTSPRSSELERQLRRVREEYRDAPNLRLTPSGAQRLFGLQPLPCGESLEALLRENFLWRTSDGLFVRSGKQD